jgi:hypothetical protein
MSRRRSRKAGEGPAGNGIDALGRGSWSGRSVSPSTRRRGTLAYLTLGADNLRGPCADIRGILVRRRHALPTRVGAPEAVHRALTLAAIASIIAQTGAPSQCQNSVCARESIQTSCAGAHAVVSGSDGDKLA